MLFFALGSSRERRWTTSSSGADISVDGTERWTWDRTVEGLLAALFSRDGEDSSAEPAGRMDGRHDVIAHNPSGRAGPRGTAAEVCSSEGFELPAPSSRSPRPGGVGADVALAAPSSAASKRLKPQWCSRARSLGISNLCHFTADVPITSAKIDGELSLRGSTVDAPLDARASNVGGRSDRPRRQLFDARFLQAPLCIGRLLHACARQILIA